MRLDSKDASHVVAEELVPACRYGGIKPTGEPLIKGVLIMLARSFHLGMCCLILPVFLVAVAGCPKEKAVETDAGSPTETAKSVKSDADIQAEVEAKLAKADLLDGNADKIVTRCASCALAMDGSEAHSLKVLDYTLYFCTERCASTFGEDTTKAVLAMKIPE